MAIARRNRRKIKEKTKTTKKKEEEIYLFTQGYYETTLTPG